MEKIIQDINILIAKYEEAIKKMGHRNEAYTLVQVIKDLKLIRGET